MKYKLQGNENIFLFICFLSFCASCNDCEPVSYSENNLRVSFFSKKTLNDTSLLFESIYGLGKPPLVERQNISMIFLPLRSHTDSTIYLLMRDDQVDTLHIYYKRFFYINPPNCQFHPMIHDISIGNKSSFDSIAIIQNKIQNDMQDNIGLFF